jgi:hypothetical protein
MKYGKVFSYGQENMVYLAASVDWAAANWGAKVSRADA